MLLERDDLLAALKEALDKAVEGSGRMALIAGEAGSGKTTLVKAFIESLDDAALIITGACDPLTTPRPLSPLLDFAANDGSGLEGLFALEHDNVTIFHEVLDRLRHSIRPVVMVIEDAHWADQATLDFIRFVGRRVADSKALVLVTYRDDEVGPDHPLRSVLGQLIPLTSTQRLHVPLLTVDAVTTLAGDSGTSPSDLFRLTDGNPFYVTEILAAGESLPSSVQDAVVGRVARLEDGPRKVVDAVSIAPRSLDIEYASLLASGRMDDVDIAVGSGVLESDGRELRFRHELARSAVETSMPPGRRHGLHRTMIGLLKEEDPTDHARLAHHAIKAEQPDLIAEHALVAAEEAKQRGAVREEVAFSMAALEVADLIDEREVADMRMRAAESLYVLDLIEPALDQVKLALEWYQREGLVEQQAEAHRRMSTLHLGTGQVEKSLAESQQSVDLLESVSDASSNSLATATATLAHHYMLRRDATHGLPIAEKAMEYATTANSETTTLSVKHTMACLELIAGRLDDGFTHLREVVDQARESDRRLHTSAITNLGSGAGEMRRYDLAKEALEEAVAWGESHDMDGGVRYARSWQARVAFEQGRWEDSVRFAEPVINTELNPASYSVLTAKGVLGRVRVRRGDPGGKEFLEATLEDSEGHHLQHRWSPASGLAEYHWLRGDNDSMVEGLQSMFDAALVADSPWARGELGYWMWKAGAIAKPPADAAAPFAHQILGNWQQAADAWSEIGCPYEVALALYEGGEVTSMLEALKIFDSLGAKPMSDRTRAELRNSGMESVPRGPSLSTRQNLAGLTNRQMEVLSLIGRGFTNSEIGKELFISKKTVEHHVSAILTKLGAGSREEAAATLEKMGA